MEGGEEDVYGRCTNMKLTSFTEMVGGVAVPRDPRIIDLAQGTVSSDLNQIPQVVKAFICMPLFVNIAKMGFFCVYRRLPCRLPYSTEWSLPSYKLQKSYNLIYSVIVFWSGVPTSKLRSLPWRLP